MAFLFVVQHGEENYDNDEPVEIICDNGAIGCRVLPAEERVENAPSTAAIDLGITALRLVSNMVKEFISWGK